MTKQSRESTTPDEPGDVSAPESAAQLDGSEADSTPASPPESRQVRRYREQMAARAARRGPLKQ